MECSPTDAALFEIKYFFVVSVLQAGRAAPCPTLVKILDKERQRNSKFPMAVLSPHVPGSKT